MNSSGSGEKVYGKTKNGFIVDRNIEPKNMNQGSQNANIKGFISDVNIEPKNMISSGVGAKIPGFLSDEEIEAGNQGMYIEQDTSMPNELYVADMMRQLQPKRRKFLGLFENGGEMNGKSYEDINAMYATLQQNPYAFANPFEMQYMQRQEENMFGVGGLFESMNNERNKNSVTPKDGKALAMDRIKRFKANGAFNNGTRIIEYNVFPDGSFQVKRNNGVITRYYTNNRAVTVHPDGFKQMFYTDDNAMFENDDSDEKTYKKFGNKGWYNNPDFLASKQKTAPVAKNNEPAPQQKTAAPAPKKESINNKENGFWMPEYNTWSQFNSIAPTSKNTPAPVAKNNAPATNQKTAAPAPKMRPKTGKETEKDMVRDYQNFLNTLGGTDYENYYLKTDGAIGKRTKSAGEKLGIDYEDFKNLSDAERDEYIKSKRQANDFLGSRNIIPVNSEDVKSKIIEREAPNDLPINDKNYSEGTSKANWSGVELDKNNLISAGSTNNNTNTENTDINTSESETNANEKKGLFKNIGNAVNGVFGGKKLNEEQLKSDRYYNSIPDSERAKIKKAIPNDNGSVSYKYSDGNWMTVYPNNRFSIENDEYGMTMGTIDPATGQRTLDDDNTTYQKYGSKAWVENRPVFNNMNQGSNVYANGGSYANGYKFVYKDKNGNVVGVGNENMMVGEDGIRRVGQRVYAEGGDMPMQEQEMGASPMELSDEQIQQILGMYLQQLPQEEQQAFLASFEQASEEEKMQFINQLAQQMQ
jgi:hypothetical protein